ncbi:hypothetical protein D3C86_2241130 [compost metagenome]
MIKAVSYKRYTTTLVEFAGPPLVRTEMTSNALNVPIIPDTRRKNVVGDNKGIVRL